MRRSNFRYILSGRRRLGAIILGGELTTTYLNRDERPCLIGYQDLGEYAPGILIKSYDFRNENEVGHYFNSRRVYLLDEVIVEPVQGLVYDLTGSLLAESTVWPLFQLYSSFPWHPKRLHGLVDVGETILVTSNSYGHWLAEDLGSIIFLLTKYPSAKVLFSKSAPKYVRDFLRMLDRETLEISGPVRVKNLLLVSKSQDSGWMHPRDIQEIRSFAPFRKVFSELKGTTSLYASRRNTKRSPKNESEIEKLFISRGFSVVRLEDLNFLDEVKLLGGVKYFAGVHGSSHVNSVFMPENSRLLDIVSENYWTELGPRIADLRNQTYLPFMFEGNPTDSVDLNLLASVLNEILEE